MHRRRGVIALSPVPLIGLIFCAGIVSAFGQVSNDPPFYGPYNAVFLPDGAGLSNSLNEHDTVLHVDRPQLPE